MKMARQILLILLFCPTLLWGGKCAGRMINPVSDICWKCIFPIYIMGAKVVSGGGPDKKTHASMPCLCPRKGIPVPIPGIPASFWQPIRLLDVSLDTWCFVSLGGIKPIKTGIKGRGDVRQQKSTNQNSFYNVHWYQFPVFAIFELFVDFICLEKGSFDIGYVTELDPMWNDDHKSMIINPDAALFGTIAAQAACAFDCFASSTHLPRDELYWCGGCQGSLFPYTGTVGAHNGGVQASLLLAGRMISKLHRELLLPKTIGKGCVCRPKISPIIVKSQYRTQMTYPIPQSKNCQPLGATEVFWQSGREFPVKGENFAYLIWRKRDCCVF